MWITDGMAVAEFPRVPTQLSISPTPETAVRRRGVRTRKAPPVSARILHVSAELWPFAFSGGLGYAVADLARQQAQNGRDVTVIAPLYRSARKSAGPLWPACEPFRVHQGGADVLIQCLEM